MSTSANQNTDFSIPPGLIDALSDFPTSREVEHCGRQFSVSPLAIYATCPVCQTHIKLRSFSAGDEIEDVVDAVLAWMNQPGAEDVATKRRAELEEDFDE